AGSREARHEHLLQAGATPRRRGPPARPGGTAIPGEPMTNSPFQALLDEQAALRRVAVLVASDPEPQQVFDLVCEEVATVLGIHSTNLTRFEDDGTQTVLAGWSVDG